MATTIGGAFAIFNKDTVNLDAGRTEVGRSSRDWLIKQLESLPEKEEDFPRLYNGMHIRYGSFARNTKLRPLDDIDLMLAFSADGTKYAIHEYGKRYTLSVPESATNLRKLCDEYGQLSSIKLVNKIVKSLSNIEHYKKSDVHRRQEAATLQLSSYEWNFDIVPALYTDAGYYLIPDGNGAWKATDPRIDQARTKVIHEKNKTNALQLIRTLKYWNKRAQMPTISSYLFENILINYFNGRNEIGDLFQFELWSFWGFLEKSIYNSVQDPKGFQGELNNIPYEDCNKISAKAKDAREKAYEAIQLWPSDEKAINKWREIFGSEFPMYG